MIKVRPEGGEHSSAAPDLIHGYPAIAAHLGITPRLARQRVASGEIPAFRQGDERTVYARPSELDRYRAVADALATAVDARAMGMAAHVERSRDRALAELDRRPSVRGAGSMSRRQWDYHGQTKYAWAVRWKDKEGRYRSRQFGARSDAEAFLAKVRVVPASIYEPLANEVTVRYVCGEYLEWYRTKVADGRVGTDTFDRLCRTVRLHIVDRIGQLLLSEADLPKLSGWHSTLMRERSLSPVVARDSASLLKSILDFAMRRDWTTTNRARDLVVELRGIPTPRVRSFHLEEVRALLAAVESPTVFGGSGAERRRTLAACYVHLAAFCGLRFGEISALDRASLDLQRCVIHVRRNLTRSGLIKGPKTAAGSRDVPLPAQLARELQVWLDQHAEPNSAGLVFSSAAGGRIEAGWFHTAIWGKALEAAGLGRGERYHFHALRHFAASWMIKGGWPITEVAAMMGHTRPSMTLDVYAHALAANRELGSSLQALTDRLVAPGTTKTNGPVQLSGPATLSQEAQ